MSEEHEVYNFTARGALFLSTKGKEETLKKAIVNAKAVFERCEQWIKERCAEGLTSGFFELKDDETKYGNEEIELHFKKRGFKCTMNQKAIIGHDERVNGIQVSWND